MKPSHEAQARLETIIDSVAASYDEGRGIDSLESTALPNTRKVVEALGHLEHVLYMGFYSTRLLNRVNLRQFIGEHLYLAFEALTEQIARAVVYRRKGGGEPEAEDVTWTERVVTEVFAGIPDLRAELALDVQAAFEGDPAAKSIEEIVFSYPSLKAITAYRVAHELYLRGVPMVARIITEHAHAETGIDIHPGAVIGKRFFIDHGTGVVIGQTTVIGDDVKLYQGVTLGALSMPRHASGDLDREAKRHPTIEDGVTVYAGATILGGETVIGKGSVIGANVWLTTSVEPGTKISYTMASGQSERSVGSSEPSAD